MQADILDAYSRDEAIQEEIDQAIEDGNELTAEQIRYLERGQTYAEKQIDLAEGWLDAQNAIAEHQAERDAEQIRLLGKLADEEERQNRELRAEVLAAVGPAFEANNLTADQRAAYRESLSDPEAGDQASISDGLVSFSNQNNDTVTYVGPDGTAIPVPRGTSINDVRDLFGIPRLARGGIIMPRPGGTLVDVAEAGYPEAVIPLDGRYRLAPEIHVHFDGTINAYGIEDLHDQLERIANRMYLEGRSAWS